MRGLNAVSNVNPSEARSVPSFDEAATSSINLQPQLRVGASIAGLRNSPGSGTRPRVRSAGQAVSSGGSDAQSVRARRSVRSDTTVDGVHSGGASPPDGAKGRRPKTGGSSARSTSNNPELRVYVHPLLRSNKAAMAHVRDIARKAPVRGAAVPAASARQASANTAAEHPDTSGVGPISEPL